MNRRSVKHPLILTMWNFWNLAGAALYGSPGQPGVGRWRSGAREGEPVERSGELVVEGPGPVLRCAALGHVLSEKET